jgi:hypothetical protein
MFLYQLEIQDGVYGRTNLIIPKLYMNIYLIFLYNVLNGIY